jgi:DnaJ domain
MDAYRTLGVPRGCTREAVKAAFRAKVAAAHPDSGGEDLAFIRLRAAYDGILTELDRRAGFDTKKPSATDETPKPTEPAQRFGVVLFDERKSPDPMDSRMAFASLLDRISATAKPRPGKFARSLGPIFLLYIVFSFPVAILMSAVAKVVELDLFDPDGTRAIILGSILFIAGQICVIASACFLVLKYYLFD